MRPGTESKAASFAGGAGGGFLTEHSLLVQGLVKDLNYWKLSEKREVRKPQADF